MAFFYNEFHVSISNELEVFRKRKHWKRLCLMEVTYYILEHIQNTEWQMTWDVAKCLVYLALRDYGIKYKHTQFFSFIISKTIQTLCNRHIQRAGPRRSKVLIKRSLNALISN